MDKDAMDISRYIKGGMNGAERARFEERMIYDPFLAEATDGFRQDPEALYDLPLTHQVNIQWLWSVVGFVAFAAVFIAIPNKVVELPEYISSQNETAHINFKVSEIQPEMQTELVIESKQNEPDLPDEVVQVTEEENFPKLLTAEYIELKSAKPIHKVEIPSIKTDEKVIYILDLKVVKNECNELQNRTFDLSELTDFTPASFSTTIAYPRARRYESIFPQPKIATYFENLQTGLTHFKSADYIQALGVFSALLKANNQEPNAQFYSALSHYNLGNYEIAETGFARMEKLASTGFSQESEWYRALSLKKLKRNDEAQDLLWEIVDGGGHYSERAMELVEESGKVNSFDQY